MQYMRLKFIFNCINNLYIHNCKFCTYIYFTQCFSFYLFIKILLMNFDGVVQSFLYIKGETRNEFYIYIYIGVNIQFI